MKKFKLLLTGVLLAASATTALADTDYTMFVSTSTSAWIGAKGDTGRFDYNVQTNDGRTVILAERYDNSGSEEADTRIFTQKVTGIDNGTYKVTLYATAQNAWCGSWDFTDGDTTVASVFAESGESLQTTAITAHKATGISSLGEYTVEIPVTNEEVNIGMILHTAAKVDWCTIQIKSLIREGDDNYISLTDYSDKVSDSAWGVSATTTNVVTADKDGKSFHETWSWSPQAAGTTIFSQTVNGLPAGRYLLDLYVNAVRSANAGSGLAQTGGYTTEAAHFYANGGATEATHPMGSFYTGNGYKSNECAMVVEVSDAGSLSMGLVIDQDGKVNWHSIRFKSLKLITGEAEARALVIENAQAALADEAYVNVTGSEKSDLEAAIAEDSSKNSTEIGEALAAFKAAKDSYDAWVATKPNYDDTAFDNSDASAEKIEAYKAAFTAEPTTAAEAAAATANLKNTEAAARHSNALGEGIEGREDYTSVITNTYAKDRDTNGWTKETGIMNTNAGELDRDEVTYPNKAIANYFDGWKGNDWSFVFSQTTAEVPAGKYRLAFISRAQEVLSEYQVNVKSSDATVGSCSLLPVHGNSGGDYGFGWDQHYVDFEISATGGVTISVEGTITTSGNSGGWVGFTDFTLVKIGDVKVVSEFEQAIAEANTLLESEEYNNVFEHSEYTALQALCSKTKDEVTVADIKAAIETYKAAKAGYDALVDLWVAYQDVADNCDLATEAKIEDFVTALNADPDPAAEALAQVAVLSAAYREMIYSNAIAEGCGTRQDFTNAILNAGATVTDTESNDFGWALVQDDGSSSINIKAEAGQEPANYPNAEFSGNYFDGGNWNGSDWTTRYTQTITVPAGKYRLSFIARGSAALRWAYVQLNDNENLRADFTLDGNQGGDYGTGWNQYFIDFETSADVEKEDIKIDVCANAKAAQQWHSFADFKLISLEQTSGIENVAVDAATNAPATIYDLYGRRVANPTHGIYVVNGRKVVIK
jgi:hypothetical protein